MRYIARCSKPGNMIGKLYRFCKQKTFICISGSISSLPRRDSQREAPGERRETHLQIRDTWLQKSLTAVTNRHMNVYAQHAM